MNRLPVELLYEVELLALSPNLPLVSRELNEVYTQASPFFKAQYILGRILDERVLDPSEFYTRALRYPICTQQILQLCHKTLKDHRPCKYRIQLPRRLFKSLIPPPPGWSRNDHPLPLLQYLYSTPDMPAVNSNSDDGYALTRAVHAKFAPLVDFLLENKADPGCHDCLCVKVAIRQKNLEMVKTLVENIPKKNRKRRRLQDRLTLDSTMLKIAVQSNAQDIVEYLYREKKVLPDMQTLKMMTF